MGFIRKAFFGALALGFFSSFSQEAPPANWYNLDFEKDGIHGASVERAYELLKGRTSETVIVAIIDSGIDIYHEDLVGKIWVNKKEVAGNGIDDDENGYVDDVNGWNFIGGPDSTFVEYDTYEITRQYAQLKEKYEFTSYVPEEEEKEFDQWKYIDKEYRKRSEKAMREYIFYRDLRDNTAKYMALVKKHLGIDSLHSDLLQNVMVDDPEVMRGKTALENIARLLGGEADFESLIIELDGAVHHFEVQVKYGYNVDYNTRDIVKDDWENDDEIGYGNNLVYGPHSEHGTHVAGIVAANRTNELGIKGVAENVLIMPIRTVPNGDERDKDVAAAIRYAVDNGAKVVNMSFGKYFENRREVVDAAVRYAEENDVLLVCSAGNSNKDTDIHTTFPNPQNEEGSKVSNWLMIGAHSHTGDENLPATFSNYGKKSVDVFAPGVAIYSTYPEDEYANNDGTSMAAPVTSGIAAILRGYFPQLRASEIRDIIFDSTRKFERLQVNTPGDKGKVDFSELSASGGIVNAAAAVELAIERFKISKN